MHLLPAPILFCQIIPNHKQGCFIQANSSSIFTKADIIIRPTNPNNFSKPVNFQQCPNTEDRDKKKRECQTVIPERFPSRKSSSRWIQDQKVERQEIAKYRSSALSSSFRMPYVSNFSSLHRRDSHEIPSSPFKTETL